MKHPHSYVVMTQVEMTDRMIADCVQTRRTSVRVSLDGSTVILKYRGQTPASMNARAVVDHAAALALVQGAAWEAP